jgi:hypothetical protein
LPFLILLDDDVHRLHASQHRQSNATPGNKTVNPGDSWPGVSLPFQIMNPLASFRPGRARPKAAPGDPFGFLDFIAASEAAGVPMRACGEPTTVVTFPCIRSSRLDFARRSTSG